MNLVFAAIANHIVVGCMVDFDLDLPWVGDWDKCMVLVVCAGQRQTRLAQIIIWALEAFVSNTQDGLGAQVTRGMVDCNPLRAWLRSSAGLVRAHVLFDRFEFVVRMTLPSKRETILA